MCFPLWIYEKFNEISLPKKVDCYSHLNMEDAIDADYAHTKWNGKDFKTRNWVNYHDLYVQTNTENFRNLGPAHFLSAPGLTWQTSLKKLKQNQIILLILICY